MNHYVLGEAGLVIRFGSMLEKMDNKELKGHAILINLKTVVRNVEAAYDKKAGSLEDFMTTGRTMVDETVALLTAELQSRLGAQVAFYNPDYSKVIKPASSIAWAPKTDGQIRTQKNLEYLWDNLSRHATLEFATGMVSCPSMVSNVPVAIITHYANDLIKWQTFRDLKLLESYTGAIKEASEFGSKLNLSKDQRSLVPFNQFNQRVFGDDTLYAPIDIQTRREVLDLYSSLGINPHTKLERLKFQLEHNSRPVYLKLRELFK